MEIKEYLTEFNKDFVIDEHIQSKINNQYFKFISIGYNIFKGYDVKEDIINVDTFVNNQKQMLLNTLITEKEVTNRKIIKYECEIILAKENNKTKLELSKERTKREEIKLNKLDKEIELENARQQNNKQYNLININSK